MNDKDNPMSGYQSQNNKISTVGLQLEQLSNAKLAIVRINWMPNLPIDVIGKILTEISNLVLKCGGSMVNPVYIESFEYMPDDKRIQLIQEHDYQFEGGSAEFARSYEDTEVIKKDEEWSYDIIHQVQFKRKHQLSNFAKEVSELLSSNSDFIQRWSISLNKNALSHPGNLFIGGIDKAITLSQLTTIFSVYGPIISIKLISDTNNNSKNNETNYGFVSYQFGSQAANCINDLNGKKIHDSNLFINYHVDVKERERIQWLDADENNNAKNFKCVFIGNLPKVAVNGEPITCGMILETIKDRLKEQFANFEILSHYFPEDTVDDRSELLKGYGFVKVATHEEAIEIINSFNGYEFHGSKLIVNRAVHNRIHNEKNHNHNHGDRMVIGSRNGGFFDVNLVTPYSYYGNVAANPLPAYGNISPTFKEPYINQLPIPMSDQQESNLYVKHIPLEWRDTELFDFYRKFGEIISAKVITVGGSRNNSHVDIGESESGTLVHGQSRGYGFVCFENPVDASRAILGTDGFEIDENNTLSASFAQKKNLKKNKRDNVNGNNPSSNSVPRYNRKFLNALTLQQNQIMPVIPVATLPTYPYLIPAPSPMIPSPPLPESFLHFNMQPPCGIMPPYSQR
ncbi:hypothetical protein KAFR_0B04420 [Kazachstania africana CBS 2517]|uniref:RRM domain-containing protein n=1 Tax=Kazachstania africana (strain ATCC 22294 / BCRC 22015 / CBS 2517 / CECT 1963 / NBRC 1671 / NRRL Y-8276) TaxID=1071382 RepID=H2AQT8_KAZAF|nr:hypothetical protein KAFR_0B04420 [Kazachstania africana CBS 2517]CCF56738.1 hypothetical protein KAFR_0B04420 [Kazachstania africana CBS 2517]